jgi:hypothetical protein
VIKTSDVEIIRKLNLILAKFREAEGIDVYDTITARSVDLAGKVVDAGAWVTVLNVEGRGYLKEFFVKCPNTNFKVSISVDKETFLEKTYAELREIQQNSKDISAFAERDEEGELTGYYVASIRNVPYYSSILVKVQNTGTTSVTFSQLFAKYNIRG